MTVDQKIVKGCMAGKRRAQSQLYKLTAPVMLGICLRYSRNLQEAEDVLQEGFIKVFRYIGNLKNPGAIYGWIRTIMINTAITYIKKNRFTFEEINEDYHFSEEESTGDETYMQIEPEKLLEIIHQMPDGYRMVLNLYVFEGHKHKEIADILDISENTSKSQLSKARRFLKKELVRKGLVNKKPVINEKGI